MTDREEDSTLAHADELARQAAERTAIARLDAKFKAMYADVPLVEDGELREDEPDTGADAELVDVDDVE